MDACIENFTKFKCKECPHKRLGDCPIWDAEHLAKYPEPKTRKLIKIEKTSNFGDIFKVSFAWLPDSLLLSKDELQQLNELISERLKEMK